MSASQPQRAKDALNRIARRGGHAWGAACEDGIRAAPEGFGSCLVWTDGSFAHDHNAECLDRQELFREIFPEPAVETSEYPDWHPRFDYLQWFGPARGFPADPFDASEQEKEESLVRVRAETKALNRLAEAEGRVGVEMERQTLKERLHHYGVGFKKQCKEMLPLLQVWLVETEREIFKDRSWQALNPEGVFTKEGISVYHSCQGLYTDARNLWRGVIKGSPKGRLEKILKNTLHRENTPSALADAQLQGLMSLLERREYFLAQAAPLHRKWELCEGMREVAMMSSEPRIDWGALPFEAPTCKYLKHAYQWIKAGNYPKGDDPTELWKYIHEKTGKSRETIRKTFKRWGWHNPYPKHPLTPWEYLKKAVLKEVAKHTG